MSSDGKYCDKFFVGDCCDLMDEMRGDGFCVDLVLTSPPYNTVRGGSGYYNSSRGRENFEGRYDVYVDVLSDDEYVEWVLRVFDGFDGVLREGGVVLWNMSYGSGNPGLLWRVVWSICDLSNFVCVDTIVWKKGSCLPNNVSRNRLSRICEFVFVFCRKGEESVFHCNKRVVSRREDTGQCYFENLFNFVEAPNNDGVCGLNKACFSSDLVVSLLDLYGRRGGVVFDPFMGSGSTGVGCRRWGCFFVGSELSEAQVRFSRERLGGVERSLDFYG